KDIAHYVRAHRALVILALVLTAVSSIFVVVPAYLLQPFVDEGMKRGSDPATWKIPWVAIDWGAGFSWHRTELILVENISPNALLALLTLVAFSSVLLKSITVYFSRLAAAAFSNRAVRSMRIDLFDKFMALSLGFYDKQKSGELVSRSTADLTVMQERISNILIGLVQHPLTAMVFLIYLVVMNYQLTLFILVVTPAVVGLIRLFGRKVKKHAARVQDATSHVTSAYQENLLCLKVVQGFGMGQRESRKFAVLSDKLYKKVMHWNRWSLGLGPMLDATVFLVIPAVLITGKVYFNHTLGELMSMIYAFSRVYSPVKNLAKVNNDLRTLQGATERVFGIMRTVPDIQERPKAKTLPRHRESVRFDRVSFAYEPGTPVLRDISFDIEAGQMVAFVGSTGAGKSTLVDLLPRFYDVTEGSITIDGTDIRDVTLDSLRRQIGYVSQEVLLFHDTIADNIRYGHPEKDMEEVIAAARAAYAHDFIQAQRAGYESVVGDRGTLLSGGQRQRIAIARAILADPSILILDEAASALDAESEQFVQEAIESLCETRTILVVAHRLSTVRKADRVYVLEGGRIVESGSHEELLAREGRFRKLHDLQFRA
ncbi:MAG: ABC transporter ATP-binding protein, partial [Desulfatiglandales bacterium]